MDQTQTIPAGYWKDAKDRLVPEEMVKPIDKERDALVQTIVTDAQILSDLIRAFKAKTMGDIQAFVELSAERFGVKQGGVKGNVSLVSFDGRYQVCRDMNDRLTFDERLQVAKTLIDECCHEWSEGSRAEVRALINSVFQVDKQGRVNIKGILSLRKLDIQHDKWQRAMTAISESIQTAESRAYLRIYERQADGKYTQINLDLAAL